MDGVLCDFDRGWVDLYNADFNKSVEYKENSYWDALVGITHFENDSQWWEWITYNHPYLFLNLPALPGAVEGVQQLAYEGHDIVIITAKPRWAAGHPSSWLQQHDVPYDEIHVTSKKYYVDCDIYIDDAIHNVTSFLEHTDALVLQHSPWPYVNRGVEVDGAVITRSWEDVLRGVRKWEESLELQGSLRAEKMQQQLRSFSADTRGWLLQTS